MTILEKIITLFFPSNKDSFCLQTIPKAPRISAIESAYSLFDYHSPAGKKLVYYCKKHHDPLLIESIATLLYEHILEEISEQQSFGYFMKPIIVSVPSSKKRLRERGFDQLYYLSKKLALLTSGVYRDTLIIKSKETPKQALVRNKHARFKNIKNSFSVTDDGRALLTHQDVILVDDLITTGATVLEISRILRRAKVRNIIIVSIAH